MRLVNWHFSNRILAYFIHLNQAMLINVRAKFAQPACRVKFIDD